MRKTVGILFLASVVVLDSIGISSAMPPKRERTLENVEGDDKNANPKGITSGIPPRRVTYFFDVGTSSTHADQQESNSTLRTVQELFPGCNGVLPRLKLVPDKKLNNLRNFRQLGDRRMVHTQENIFAMRDYVIIGWLNGNDVAPLCTLFNTPDEFVVFDMIKDQWYTLNPDEFHKLGTGRHYQLVKAREDVAHLHRPISNEPIDIQAHFAACEQANREADRIEALPDDRLPRQPRYITPLGHRIVEVTRGYTNTYKRATNLYKNTHDPNQTGM